MTDHRLIETYRNTDFIIDAPDGQLVLHVGEPNRQIDALLRDRGFSECAYITASNPQSVPLQSAENAHRHAALMERVRKLGYQFLSGRGVGTGDYWPPEESLLVIGIER